MESLTIPSSAGKQSTKRSQPSALRMEWVLCTKSSACVNSQLLASVEVVHPCISSLSSTDHWPRLAAYIRRWFSPVPSSSLCALRSSFCSRSRLAQHCSAPPLTLLGSARMQLQHSTVGVVLASTPIRHLSLPIQR